MLDQAARRGPQNLPLDEVRKTRRRLRRPEIMSMLEMLVGERFGVSLPRKPMHILRVSEIARKFVSRLLSKPCQGVTPRTVYNWKSKYLEGYGGKGFKLKSKHQHNYPRGPRKMS